VSNNPFDFSEQLKNTFIESRRVIAEIEDAYLEDLHFMAGNEWVKGKGTPTRTPFDYLLANSRKLHEKYGWGTASPFLQVKTICQLQR
jgi:hypothetical protein